MPATIPAHPAAVLPLKLWRPRWFDGVALAAGAAAPDIGYLSTGIGPGIRSHAWHSLLWWSLPVALLLSYLLRRAAPVVAAHLPDLRSLAPRDYGVLGGRVAHPLGVSACSALLGALSHLVWDTFTHPYVLIGHPFLGDDTHLPALRHIAVAGLPWWRVIQLISEPVGAAVVLAVAVHIGRNRLLIAWHGQPPPVARRPAVFWPTAAGTTAVVVAVALALPGNDQGPNVLGVRAIAAVAIGLMTAAEVNRHASVRTHAR